MSTMSTKTTLKSNAPYYVVMQEILDALQGSTYYTNVPSQKVYRAKLVQNGVQGSAITASVLQNTTGVTPVIAYVDTGSYSIKATGLFAATSYLNAHMGAYTASISGSAMAHLARSGSDGVGGLTVYNANYPPTASDGFDPLFIEIVLHA